MSDGDLWSRYATVLFDMDGTLVDSNDAVESVWTAWATSNGIEPRRVLEYCHGRDVASTVRRFRADLDDRQVAAMVEGQLDLECEQLDGVRPAPGAHGA